MHVKQLHTKKLGKTQKALYGIFKVAWCKRNFSLLLIQSAAPFHLIITRLLDGHMNHLTTIGLPIWTFGLLNKSEVILLYRQLNRELDFLVRMHRLFPQYVVISSFC